MEQARDPEQGRQAIVAQIKATHFSAPKGRTTLDLLRELRAGRS